MSEHAQETVIDVLAALNGWYEERAAQWAGDVQEHPQELGYESIANPLKLTGGRVCLQWRDHVANCSGSICWHPDGLVCRYDNGDRLTGAHAAGELQYCLDNPRVELSPILRERTPFDESDHD